MRALHKSAEAGTDGSEASDGSARERGETYRREIPGNRPPSSAPFNRWKLAAGGRPSKISEDDVLGHQTTVAATYREAVRCRCKITSTPRGPTGSRQRGIGNTKLQCVQ